MNNEIVDSFIEVELDGEDDFRKVRETLTRIGVSSRKEKKLFQSCHILHKQGKYYIVHFKQMFALDGKPSLMDENDTARLNTIANLLAEWNLLKIKNAGMTADPVAPMSQIKVVPYREKGDWDLVPKYNIGNKKN
tara:strand:+ start:1483 stop:1887 length:405 start_codon:yes stop_codon:yes gene_type:complete